MPGYLFIRNSIRHLQQMDVAARNVRLQLSGGAQPALRLRWYGDYEINPLSRASRRAKALGYPGRSPPARAISDYLFKDHVTVHQWGHPQTWERGRPARTVSPRARCLTPEDMRTTYPRCCVSTRQYAIMRRLNECEARHRNGI